VSFFLFILVFLVGIALSIIFRKWAYDWVFIITTAFALSVITHLILDMATPMGLPLFLGKSLLAAIGVPFEVILTLTPILNIIGIAITIILALISIKFLAKQIGGKLALILLFIPVWGTLLLLGIALCTLKGLWVALGILLLILFVVGIGLILLVGHGIDIMLKQEKEKMKEPKKNKPRANK
jgi:hypothetical protein